MNSLTKFPEFSKLDLSHKTVLRQIANNFPSYSDFNFVSLFTWDNDDAISLSDLRGNLVIKFSDYSSGEIFLSFLGDNDIERTIDDLLLYCAKNKIDQVLKLVGQSVIEAIPPHLRHKYTIHEDRDNHDYILSSGLLADEANYHPKKRTKFHSFERNYGDRALTTSLDLTDTNVCKQIEVLLSEWQRVRNREDADVEREFSAIRRSLHHAQHLDIEALGTYVEGRLIAFTIFEIVNGKTAMLHYGKSNTEFLGSNEIHQMRLAKHLHERGIETMNNEQDLGVPGLRDSKMNSKPIDFLRKYTISHAKQD